MNAVRSRRVHQFLSARADTRIHMDEVSQTFHSPELIRECVTKAALYGAKVDQGYRPRIYAWHDDDVRDEKRRKAISREMSRR